MSTHHGNNSENRDRTSAAAAHYEDCFEDEGQIIATRYEAAMTPPPPEKDGIMRDEEVATPHIVSNNPRQPVAQFPGAVHVRGVNARRRAEEMKRRMMFGQTSFRFVRRMLPSLNRQGADDDIIRSSSFHCRMDDIGRSTHRVETAECHPYDNGGNGSNKKTSLWCQRLQVVIEGLVVLLLGTAVAFGFVVFILAKVQNRSLFRPRSSPLSPKNNIPTMSPSSFASKSPPSSSSSSLTDSQWKLSAEIIGAVDTFGYEVDLNDMGTRIAISAPKAHGGRGQVEVYEKLILNAATERKDSSSSVVVDHGMEVWARLGEPIVGDSVGDDASLGMDLSGDGTVLAVGYPGNGNGFVRVFKYTTADGWIQKGQTLAGPSLDAQFGASLSLNQNGTVLAVGAPQAGDEEQGMFQVYEWSARLWAELGAARYGRNSGDNLGKAVGMNRLGDSLVVGTPNYDDSANGENAGLVQIFQYVKSSPTITSDGCLTNCWTDVSSGGFLGDHSGSRFGQRVSSLVEAGGSYHLLSSTSAYNLNGDSPSEAQGLRYVCQDKEAKATKTACLASVRQSVYREGIGYAGDMDHDRPFFCESTLNDHDKMETGIVRCFGVFAGDMYWEELTDNSVATTEETHPQPLPLGSGTWFGMEPRTLVPSISVMTDKENLLFAVGYQGVLIHDGEDVPGVVRMYRNRGKGLL